MDQHLPPVFDLLAAIGAPVIHYKVCSTFDSAPHIGSIGRAIDIAARKFEGWIPLVIADPGMGRYQAIGNLFASDSFWAVIPHRAVIIGLLARMGVYLLWMQQRVYRQHWIITLLKFSVLGALYFMMLITALISLVLTTWVNT